MGRYFERMKGVIEGHGGSVEKFVGDAVMAVFGVPVAHGTTRCARAGRPSPFGSATCCRSHSRYRAGARLVRAQGQPRDGGTHAVEVRRVRPHGRGIELVDRGGR
jgi:class 3 adenylate cyclase